MRVFLGKIDDAVDLLERTIALEPRRSAMGLANSEKAKSREHIDQMQLIETGRQVKTALAYTLRYRQRE